MFPVRDRPKFVLTSLFPIFRGHSFVHPRGGAGVGHQSEFHSAQCGIFHILVAFFAGFGILSPAEATIQAWEVEGCAGIS